MIAVVSGTIAMLVISDIWCPILFYIVYDLLNLRTREIEVDDSFCYSDVISTTKETMREWTVMIGMIFNNML